jgi:hypothetical protein
MGSNHQQRLAKLLCDHVMRPADSDKVTSAALLVLGTGAPSW